VRAHCAVVVRGNHDRACTGLDDLQWFNPVAREAALWTLDHLTRENIDYTATLTKGPVLLDGFEVVHGSPYDEDEYVLASMEAGQAFAYLESRLAFFGHTHVQGGFIWNHSRVEIIGRVPATSGGESLPIDTDCAYLINPGSVGQPRDGDPRAAYVIYDSEARAVTYRRVPYNVETTQKKIRDAGLPAILADRLTVGR
jgi:diadenosine tetraphosphatase ApaH/serine/threonine PP2A family protein phosphatase